MLPLFISYRSSGKKLIKYEANSCYVIMSVILIKGDMSNASEDNIAP